MNNLRKKVTSFLDSDSDSLLLVAKLFNLKENMLVQVIKGLLYKKVVSIVSQI